MIQPSKLIFMIQPSKLIFMIQPSKFGVSVLSSLMPSSSLQVAVSTHHLGHYEFRICDRALNTSTVSLGVGLRTWRPCKVLPKWEGN